MERVANLTADRVSEKLGAKFEARMLEIMMECESLRRAPPFREHAMELSGGEDGPREKDEVAAEDEEHDSSGGRRRQSIRPDSHEEYHG